MLPILGTGIAFLVVIIVVLDYVLLLDPAAFIEKRAIDEEECVEGELVCGYTDESIEILKKKGDIPATIQLTGDPECEEMVRQAFSGLLTNASYYYTIVQNYLQRIHCSGEDTTSYANFGIYDGIDTAVLHLDAYANLTANGQDAGFLAGTLVHEAVHSKQAKELKLKPEDWEPQAHFTGGQASCMVWNTGDIDCIAFYRNNEDWGHLYIGPETL